MLKMHILSISLLLVFCCMFLLSCSLEEDYFNDGLAAFEITLSSTESNFQQFNIDLEQVIVHLVGEDSLIAETQRGIYDLSELGAGTGVLLVRDTLPSTSKIEELHFRLGPNNSLTLNNQTRKLESQGNKPFVGTVKAEKLLIEEELTVIHLKVDLEESIVKKDNGDFAFKPVIRVVQ